MNWRGAWELTKSTWFSWFQQRSFFFLLAFGWMIPPLVWLFIWSTAAGNKPVAGMTRGEFVAYYLLFILVNQLTYSQTNWVMGDSIREGHLSFSLLRPISPHVGVVAAELAGKIVYMMFVVPVAIILAVILHPEIHVTWMNAILFCPLLILAWLLRFMWGYWLAILAFWANRASSLMAVQESAIYLLAGMVAPISLLPAPLQICARILPFRYMISFPIEVLTGQLSIQAVLDGLLVLLIWLLFACGLFVLLWSRGIKRYTAVGG